MADMEALRRQVVEILRKTDLPQDDDDTFGEALRRTVLYLNAEVERLRAERDALRQYFDWRRELEFWDEDEQDILIGLGILVAVPPDEEFRREHGDYEDMLVLAWSDEAMAAKKAGWSHEHPGL